MRPVIVLFAKAPVPGRVKTRLIPPLTAASAASWHSSFVSETIKRLEAFRDIADIELHTDIATDAWADAGVARALQHEGDLGLKMFQALSGALAAGRSQAIILGTDAPTLPPDHLKQLMCSCADVALGPADDGGYYAIACRRVHPAMFQGVPWSTADALNDTVAACLASGLSVELGPAWWDVDTPADLERLRAESIFWRQYDQS
jgi:rSAM/selenodomain-associated transferase 1